MFYLNVPDANYNSNKYLNELFCRTHYKHRGDEKSDRGRRDKTDVMKAVGMESDVVRTRIPIQS